MTQTDRLREVIEKVKRALRMSNFEFSKSLGYRSATYLSDILGGHKPVSDLFLEKLKTEFSINPRWIKTGKESMFIGDTDLKAIIAGFDAAEGHGNKDESETEKRTNIREVLKQIDEDWKRAAQSDVKSLLETVNYLTKQFSQQEQRSQQRIDDLEGKVKYMTSAYRELLDRLFNLGDDLLKDYESFKKIPERDVKLQFEIIKAHALAEANSIPVRDKSLYTKTPSLPTALNTSEEETKPSSVDTLANIRKNFRNK